MGNQLDRWRGDFGDRYTERNEFDWRRRIRPFREMLGDLDLKEILEVGCNRGYNLKAIKSVIKKEVNLTGIDPNKKALKMAPKTNPQMDFIEGNAYRLPFEDEEFDLSFTSGVLIHIPPDRIDKAIEKIYRVSKKYILSIEYYSEEEEEVEYRGEENMLWKGDFYRHYKSIFPSLTLVRKGFWGPEDGFDRCHWWLLKKNLNPILNGCCQYYSGPDGIDAPAGKSVA